MRRLFGTCHAAAMALALGAVVGGLVAPASAAVSTRSEYVAQVEPICKKGTEANRGLLQGVEKMVAKGELRRASPRFSRAAAALGKARKQIALVPRPPADTPRLTRWLRLLKTQELLLRKMASALQQSRRSLVQNLAHRLLQGARRANNIVVGFDFKYCRLNPANFV